MPKPLAVNFTVGLAFSWLRSRLRHYFRGDGSLAYSLRSCSYVQLLHFCYFLTFVTFFNLWTFYIFKKCLLKILSKTSRSTF